ncbi:MAG: response regulator [Planctomycetota bacterium]|nr:MAG: response regulator [Planctomycetota bacterium]
MTTSSSSTSILPHSYILLVDDESANRRIGSLVIKRMGLAVTCAANIEEALSCIQTQRYCAALLDLSLGQESGQFLAVEIRRQLGDATPALFAWTATKDSAIESSCLDAGMDYVLEKPLKEDLLRAALQRFANVSTSSCALPRAPASSGNESLQTTLPHDVLDMVLVNQHRHSGGEDLFNELVTILSEEGPAQLSACQAALATDDQLAAAKACHRLAGCAASIGAQRLAQHCRNLEQVLRNKQDLVEDDVDLLQSLHAEAVKALHHRGPRDREHSTNNLHNATTQDADRLSSRANNQELELLLVEDSPAERLLFTAALSRSKQPVQIRSVETLANALSALGESTPNAIILDLSLPDSDGLETFLAIHRRAPQTPTIVLSGMDDEEVILALIQQGAQDFLVKKQVREGELMRAIKLAIARSDTQESTRTRLAPHLPLLPISGAKKADKNPRSGLDFDLYTQHSLGSGGMADVYLADQYGLNRQVAVKVLRSGSSNPRALELFQTEARVLAQLEHPHIVPVYDMGETFIVMQRIQGQTLAESLSQDHEHLRLRQHVKVLADVCDAVAYAHAKGIIHRDIKPENIMFADHGISVLVDWGLALTIDPPADGPAIAPLMPEDSRLLCVGTPAYLPPEVANADRELIGYNTDVFLLGGTLYALLAYRPLYKNMHTREIMTVASCGFFKPIDEVAPQAPAALRALATTATAALPQDRPSVRAFTHVLRKWLALTD